MNEQIGRYISYLRSEKRYSDHTCMAYRKDLLLFEDYLQKMYDLVSAADVENKHLRSYLVWLKSEKKYHPRTIRRKFSSLKTFFKFLLKIQEINSNPCNQITLPKVPKRIPQFLSPKQVDVLLDPDGFDEGYAGRLERILLEMLILTGVRRAELLSMKIEDLDMSASHIRIHGKGGKQRLLPLSRGYVRALEAFMQYRDEVLGTSIDEEYIFLSESGKRVTESGLYQIVKKHIARCSTIDQKSPHILRHTFATMLSNGGADLNIIKELLGHASLASTQVYTHASIDQLKKVYQKAHPRGNQKET